MCLWFYSCFYSVHVFTDTAKCHSQLGHLQLCWRMLELTLHGNAEALFWQLRYLIIDLTGISGLRNLWVRLSHCPELSMSTAIQKVPGYPWEGRVNSGAVPRCLSKTSFDHRVHCLKP